MRRALALFGLSVAALIAALAGTWAFLFLTPLGHDVVKRLVEEELSDLAGGTVKIGALKGRLPTHLVLEDVSLDDEAGTAAHIAQAALDWRPTALLSGSVLIDRLDIAGAHYVRRPSGRQQGPQHPFKIPDDLPRVLIEKFSLRNAEVVADNDAGAIRLPITGAGRLDMGGAHFDASLRLTSADDKDAADIAARLDPKAAAIHVAVNIRSPAGGAVATLAGMKEGLDFSARGDGPPQNFRIVMNGMFGGAGKVETTLTGDLVAAKSAAASGRFDLGPAARDLSQALGPTIAFDLTLAKTPKGLRLDIAKLAAEAGTITGALAADTAADGTILRATATGAATLKGLPDADLDALIGRAVTFDAAAERRQGGYAVNGRLIGARASLAVADLAPRRDGALSGLVDARLTPSKDAAALLPAGARARFAATRANDGALRFDHLLIDADGVGGFSGAATFDAALKGAIDGVVDLRAGTLASLGLPVSGGAKGRVRAEGRPDNFGLTFDASAPLLAGPAVRIRAALVGLPGVARGRVALDQGAASLTADIDADRKASIRVTNIMGRAPDATLDGSASWAVASRRLVLDLAWRAAHDFTVLKDVALSGEGRVKGALALGQGASGLDAAVGRATIAGVAISGARLNANGPAHALAVSLTAKSLAAKGLTAANLAAAAHVNVETRSGTLETLTAKTRDETLRLAAPAKFSFGTPLRIEGLRLAFGDGRIALDGQIGPKRWRAQGRLDRLPLSGTGAVLDADIDLDTDRQEAARGRFRLTEAGDNAAPFAFGGAAQWNGKRLLLKDDGANAAVAFDLAVPLVLSRAPRLGVTGKGALSGAARYKGPVEALADFLPPAVQTVEGALDARFDLQGTLAAPSLSGAISLRDGSYTDLVSGLFIDRIALDAKAEPRRGAGGDTSIVAVTATGRGGGQGDQSLKFAGEARLGRDARFDGTLTFARAEFSAEAVDRVVIDGAAKLSGPLSHLTLGGDLSILRLDARLKPTRQTSLTPIEIRVDGRGLEDTGEAAPRPSLDFALAIAAKDNISVKGRGLDSQWRGALNVGGSSKEPVVTGRLDLQKGAFEFAGRRFQLTRGAIVFDRLDRNDPALDLRAEYTTTDGTLAVVTITGRASAPVVALTSTPSLPPEDVAALVLFGKRAVELTGGETLQAAQALAQLSGFGGGVRVLGLDTVSVDFDQTTGVGALSVGKSIGRSLFVSARQDARGENGSVRVEYGLSNSFTIETELKQNGDQTVSANWKKDF